MRCSHMQQRVRKIYRKPLHDVNSFSFHGDSPACEHLTHKFLLRYYLFKPSISYFTDIATVFCYNFVTE